MILAEHRSQLDEHVCTEELRQAEVVLSDDVGRQVATNQQVRSPGELAGAPGRRQHRDEHIRLLQLNSVVRLCFVVDAPS